MRRAITLVCIVVAGALLQDSTSVLAHHSFSAAFDENMPVNLEGVVTKVELVNPHTWVWMDVTDQGGTVTNWGFEGGPPVNLFRNGFRKGDLPIGSEIKVSAIRPRAARAEVSPFSSSISMVERSSWGALHRAPMVGHAPQAAIVAEAQQQKARAPFGA